MVYNMTKRVNSEAGAFQATTSCVEIETFTGVLKLFGKQQYIHCVIFTIAKYSQKGIKHDDRSERMTIMGTTTISSVIWILCPGHMISKLK
jgi:hypothetical protein